MVHPNAEVAVIEFLAAPDPLAAADRGADKRIVGGPVARIVRGKRFAARRETIEILKQRDDRERCLLATRFVDQSGNRWEYLVAAEHDGSGWKAHGVAGGSDGAPSARPRGRTDGPLRLEVFGQWGRDIFYAAGRLTGREQDVATGACLTLANGAKLSADLQDGLALFIGREGSAPVTWEILDQNGRSMARQRQH